MMTRYTNLGDALSFPAFSLSQEGQVCQTESHDQEAGRFGNDGGRTIRCCAPEGEFVRPENTVSNRRQKATVDPEKTIRIEKAFNIGSCEPKGIIILSSQLPAVSNVMTAYRQSVQVEMADSLFRSTKDPRY